MEAVTFLTTSSWKIKCSIDVVQYWWCSNLIRFYLCWLVILSVSETCYYCILQHSLYVSTRIYCWYPNCSFLRWRWQMIPNHINTTLFLGLCYLLLHLPVLPDSSSNSLIYLCFSLTTILCFFLICFNFIIQCRGYISSFSTLSQTDSVLMLHHYHCLTKIRKNKT